MIPKEFNQVYTDFVNDLLTTFPELESKIKVDLTNEQLEAVFDHCKEIYPVRFFDILNKNVEIFNDAEVNTEFLPGVAFSALWHDEGLSDQTK